MHKLAGMAIPSAPVLQGVWPTLLLALVLSTSGVSAGVPGHGATRPAPSENLSLDTLAWVGTSAVTAADLVRRIEWMPWPGKQDGAGMDSAKVRALQSLAGECLLAQEAEREGLGDSGSVARMRASLRKALVRDALYHDVDLGAVKAWRGRRASAPLLVVTLSLNGSKLGRANRERPPCLS